MSLAHKFSCALEPTTEMPLTSRSPKNLMSKVGRHQRMALSGVLGAVSAFSFAPYSVWPLMLISLALLVLLLDASQSRREAASVGWIFAFCQFFVSLFWISAAFEFQADMPAWVGFIAVGALAAYLAIYPALALWLAAQFWSGAPIRVLIFATFWTAAEWLRGHMLTGFPWNTTAQIWSDTPIILQSVRLAGPYALTLFTVALSASAALAAEFSASARRLMLLMTALGAIVAVDGWWRLHKGGAAPVDGFRVHLIQANVRQDVEADPRRQLAILELYESLTAKALEQNGIAPVIWPETAIEYDIEGDELGRVRLARVIGQSGLLILGTVGRHLGPAAEFLGARNSMLVLDGSANVRAVYDKTKLVPFGEYLPAAKILSRVGLSSVAAGSTRFVPGTGSVTLAPGIAPFSPAICYEIIFPRTIIPSRARPDWILNISNDAWFGESWGPYQHFAQARLRAVEEGVPVVRSTPTGISGVIDPYGRVVAQTHLGERVVLSAVVPASLAPTPYSLAEDWLFFGLLIAVGTAGLAGGRRGEVEPSPA